MPLEHYWVEISEDGLLSRTEGDKANRLGGEKAPWSLVRTNSHQTIFLVTTEGRCAAIASLAIPVQSGEEAAVPAHKIAPLHPNDILQSIFTVPIETKDLPDRYVITISRQGMIKRSAVSELPGASVSDFVLTKVNSDDELYQVLISDGTQDVLLATASGMCIRFNENDVRPMGLVAVGVNAIKLKAGDYIVGASLVGDKDEVALLTRLGNAKRIPANDFPVQGRYGQGVIGWKLDSKDQIAALLVGKLTDKGISHFSKTASKVFTITNATARKRASNGQNMYPLKAGDEVIGFTTIIDYSEYWGEGKA
jgi:DNA gyrase/topoisomerase IV subunit A